MSRIIDTERLKNHMRMKPEDWYTTDERWIPEHEIAQYIETCPLADIVAVVRCRDCRDFDMDDLLKGKSRGFCNDIGGYVYPDNFCARAERRKK